MQVYIEWTYKTKTGIQAKFSSEEMQAKAAIALAEDIEKTGRVKALTFIDRHERSWNLKELKKLMEEIKTEPHDIIIYFDGGFDHETGKAGLGCVIYYEKDGKSYRIRKNAFVEGLISNNEAEYAALHLGIMELEWLGVRHLPVTFIGDSKVVINQLNDEWPCYEEELARWMTRIEQKLEEMGISPILKSVSRKLNKEADQLAAQAMDGQEILSHKEL